MLMIQTKCGGNFNTLSKTIIIVIMNELRER